MNAYIESYGCSLNKADSEAIKGHLSENGFDFTAIEKAKLIIINACAVKEQTENRMLRRIRELFAVSKKSNAQLIVFGCLSEINPKAISEISPEIIYLPPSLAELSKFLKIEEKEFSPEIKQEKFNPFISIIPISRGCISNCSYCCVRSARGKLKSYSLEEIKKKFRECIKETKEIWITAQDTGAYGLDRKTNLAFLLKELLKEKGNFRIRVGMINPQHLKNLYPQLIPLYKDERMYKFFHVPIQSGSNRILKLMNRNYSAELCRKLFKKLKKDFPSAAISTDIIVGFPSEKEAEFNQTLKLLEFISPDIVNISRFGARPNTEAKKMKGQLHGRIKKKRSRIASILCRKIAFEKNKSLEGKILTAFVSEKGEKGGFIGRTSSYKPVLLNKKGIMGKFVKIKIVKAFPTYSKGKILKIL